MRDLRSKETLALIGASVVDSLICPKRVSIGLQWSVSPKVHTFAIKGDWISASQALVPQQFSIFSPSTNLKYMDRNVVKASRQIWNFLLALKAPTSTYQYRAHKSRSKIHVIHEEVSVQCPFLPFWLHSKLDILQCSGAVLLHSWHICKVFMRRKMFSLLHSRVWTSRMSWNPIRGWKSTTSIWLSSTATAWPSLPRLIPRRSK